jgi:arsenate reductase
VLFVCNYNSARSQMAVAFFNRFAPEGVSAQSAGITPGMLSMKAVMVMAEKGYDLFGAPVRSVEEVLKESESFTHLVVIGDEAVRDACPPVPGVTETLLWDLPDPSTFEGSDEELMTLLEQLSTAIELKVKTLL